MEWVKSIHITCVFLSFCGFFLRGIWKLTDSDLLQAKWVRVLPHVVDSMLLLSALMMLYIAHLSVLQNNWLIAKICALILYILLGMFAFKYARTKFTSALAWGAALLVFIYIVSVAVTKSVVVFSAVL